jgi:hypothetical protein
VPAAIFFIGDSIASLMNFRARPMDERWRTMGADLEISGNFGRGLRFDGFGGIEYYGSCGLVSLGSLKPKVRVDFTVRGPPSSGLFFRYNYYYCKLSNSGLSSF